MKKINLLFVVLLSIIGFTACEDTKDPVINQAALDGSISFKLNETQYKNFTYVLTDANATSDMDALTCVQPDYGFTAAVTYTTQVCANSTFAPNTFESLATTVNGEKVGINTKELNKAIIKLFDKTVVARTLYFRLKAVVSDATPSPLNDTLTVKPLYSNVISLKVMPYEFPLFPYNEITPTPYYIIGLGDGKWTNSTAGLGVSLTPLGVVAGKKYDLNGNGEFVYTGYFQASRGFKLIRDISSWAEQWGMKDGKYTHNTGDDIKVPADGFYKITLNSIDNTLTIVPAAITPASFTKIGLIGAFNSWASDEVLTATESVKNHTWYTTYKFTSDSECKFRANGGWDTNWGFSTFPFGVGTPGGANIPAKAGTYVVVFNDIDATYTFIKK
ncbi:MAG: hypothetical protein H6Q20_2524 [Bacteroidetes bacterium]|nr:hypothetical protein [Bacteroidota bacterium]